MLDSFDNQKLRQMLVVPGFLTEVEFKEVSEEALSSSKDIAQVILEKNYLSATELSRLVADAIDIPYVELSKIDIPPDVLAEIPELVARENQAVAFGRGPDGLKVAFAGKPNVGKSSLFNALLDMERAIVTEIPGTTRDIIQESLDIDGIPVVLMDTAGIRKLDSQNSSDYIESIGINNTKTCIENADLVLITGGLGPTKDDITKHTLCEYFQSQLPKHYLMNVFFLRAVHNTLVTQPLPSLYTYHVFRNRVRKQLWFQRHYLMPHTSVLYPQHCSIDALKAVLHVFHTKEDRN